MLLTAFVAIDFKIHVPLLPKSSSPSPRSPQSQFCLNGTSPYLPPGLFLYHPINLSHQLYCLCQNRNDALIVSQVVVGQLPPFAVFEPLLADLIPADVEVPDLRWDAFKILSLVD